MTKIFSGKTVNINLKKTLPVVSPYTIDSAVVHGFTSPAGTSFFTDKEWDSAPW